MWVLLLVLVFVACLLLPLVGALVRDVRDVGRYARQALVAVLLAAWWRP